MVPNYNVKLYWKQFSQTILQENLPMADGLEGTRTLNVFLNNV